MENKNYADLLKEAKALIDGVPEDIPNMANISALLWYNLDRINWVGFYTVTPDGEGLLLGPFAGKPACIRIPRGKGVCGTSLSSGRTIVVNDVSKFPGHIACDPESASEVVVPVRRGGEIIAVLDVDSPLLSRFTPEDVDFLEGIARLLGENAN